MISIGYTTNEITCVCCRAAGENRPATVTKPKSRLRKTYTVYDENDIAYKVRGVYMLRLDVRLICLLRFF